MQNYSADVLIENKNGIVKTIGKSCITHPEIKWNGKGIKWFDETKYLKKKPAA